MSEKSNLKLDAPRRREADKGLMTRWWDFIDERNIHKRVVSFAILLGTVSVTIWATRYAEGADRPGLEVAAILAAVLAPYMALQAAGLKYFFEGK